MAHSPNHVAEMQGLYGPFTMAERVVQKIWLHGDFARDRLWLSDGRRLVIRLAGAWNLLGGPDFRGARLLIADREVTGDVEVHFHSTDWRAHGHEADPAYANVVLHVVLFPPSPEAPPARRSDGQAIPTLVLLPYLHRDLEEYASDDALEVLTARDESRHCAALAALPAAELPPLLRAQARRRWQQKVHFAQLRIERLGWSDAAHHAALEILGYRRNRAPMLAVAGRHPLSEWVSGMDLPGVFAGQGTHWSLQGVRPANHPRRRLQQYQRWVTISPDWPERLAQFVMDPPAGAFAEQPTKEARHRLAVPARREKLMRGLLGGAVGGTRLDTLLCDGFLPLLTARDGSELFPLWFHWFLGDVPDLVRRTLPRLGLSDGREQPLCHGYAQGLLGWILSREARASD
jgi:Protein of unknown function (DUF2851)